MTGIFSREWLNANLSRAYPLSSKTGGAMGSLPSDLLVDGAVLFDRSDISEVYINSITVSDLDWQLSITAIAVDGTILSFGNIVSVAYTSEQFSTAKFMATSGSTTVAGNITVGNPEAARRLNPGTTTLTRDQGLIDPAVVKDISGLYITGIRVGDKILSGEVEIVAEDGISLSFDADTNALRITNTKYTVPADNLEITSDEELLSRITTTYGSPIRTINGVSPDSSGNIRLVVPATEDPNSIYVAAESLESNSLQLVLTKDPCISVGSIETLSENLEQLNIRAARLDASVKALDAGINSIATQMTRLS